MKGVKARKRVGGVGPAAPEWRCPVCGTDHDGWLTSQGRVLVVPDDSPHPMGAMGEEMTVPPGVPMVDVVPGVRDKAKDRSICHWPGGGDSDRLTAEEAGIDQ